MARRLGDFLGKGQNDSFYEAKMSLRVEVAEFDWDMSLKAQSRRALAMSNVWLHDEDERIKGGSRFGSNVSGWSKGEGEEGEKLALILILYWE
ncbi:hypothetical protein Gogos_018274 [Gossypium gossypioides]|uniref:Uncharacterized protein n=1 Tax=Gossypium gossypioides TaxID=34282 RepID=A0A7J9BF64_GOSGO|nr:hypothetical protein [Gossypium gossypioides]